MSFSSSFRHFCLFICVSLRKAVPTQDVTKLVSLLFCGYVGYFSLPWLYYLFISHTIGPLISILLQHHISKRSKYFWYTSRSVQQISAPYRAMLQVQHFIILSLNLTSVCWWNEPSCWMPLLPWRSWFASRGFWHFSLKSQQVKCCREHCSDDAQFVLR